MDKIDIRDLRVGDWLSVHHPTMPAENIQISADWIKTIERINNGLIKEDSPLFRIVEPIPLTGEILEKNGFVKELDKDNTHYRFGLTEGCTFFSVKYARSVFQWLGPLDFKYVHELQHALRLCGIEKEIEL